MNLVQLASDLEFVPKEQLAQMSQDPNTSYPPYLVLAEIQRRTQNDKAYAAMKPQPTSTVAEEVVNEFVQPKGLQAGIPSGSAPTDVFSPESSGMPASAPMQMAASGGITGYNPGGSLNLEGDSLSQSFTNPNNETIPVESLSTDQREEIVQNSQGLTTAQKVVLGLDAAALALLVTPAPGARIAAGATKLLGLGIRGGAGLKKIYDAKRAQRLLKAGQKELNRKGGVPATVPYNPNTVLQTGKEALRRELPYKLLGGSTLAGTTYALMDGDSPMSLNPNEQQLETDAEKEVRLAREAEEKRLADIQTARDKAAEGNITSLSDFVSAKDKAERRRAGLDMAQLGGVILGSQNLTDLGKGITGIASNMQTRDAAEGLSEAQRKYYEAQTGKAEAETVNIPFKQLSSEIKAIQDYIVELKENTMNPDDPAFIQTIAAYEQKLAQLMSQQDSMRGLEGTYLAGGEAEREAFYKRIGIGT